MSKDGYNRGCDWQVEVKIVEGMRNKSQEENEQRLQQIGQITKVKLKRRKRL